MTEQQIFTFIKQYEHACNSYDFTNVTPLLDEKAIFFFSDATLFGREAIQKAFEKTWKSLGNDTYALENITILHIDEHSASIVYDFHWDGTDTDGNIISGNGRGTSILVQKKNGKIVKMHEHLSQS